MTSARSPLTLSREELYQLVWSKPMVELAKDFQLSDVALAKRCRKLAVPVPGRGYWARVTAGQTPRITPLRKRTEQVRDYAALTFVPPRDQDAPARSPADTEEPDAPLERIQALELKGDDNLKTASPAVKRTAVKLKRPWRGEIVWNRGERRGPIIPINVSDDVADRALLVCDRLLRAATDLGWTFEVPPKSEERAGYSHRHEEFERSTRAALPPGHLVVEGEVLHFRIDERHRRFDHVPTNKEKAEQRRGHYVYMPRWDYEATGELRFYISAHDSRHALRTWKDSIRTRLEHQIKTILLGMLDQARRIKADRERKRLAEIERRLEEDRRRKLAERREANAELVHELEAQAGAWMRARVLRAYLRAARRALGNQTLQASLQGEIVDFMAWADHYLDQLDPLSTAPHDSDLKQDRTFRYGNDQTLQRTLSRLLGLDWQDSSKLMSAGVAEDDASEIEDDYPE